MNPIALLLAIFFVAVNASNLNPAGCGQRPVGPDRIVGGEEAFRGDWGWQVSIYFRGSHNCGGVLLNDNWVATAAHCVSTLETSYYSLLFGIHDRNIRESYSVERAVSKIIVNADYVSYPAPLNDIALFKLERPVAFSNYVLPACIKDDDDEFIGGSSWATGWGSRRFGAGSSIIKMQVETPVLSDAQCLSQFRPYTNATVHICAGESGKTMGPCNGDSGGPLAAQGEDGRWYVIGLTSFGLRGCGDGAAFTRVSRYIPWIRRQLAEN